MCYDKIPFLSGDYMISVGWDEILSRFAKDSGSVKTLYKLYPAIICEKLFKLKLLL